MSPFSRRRIAAIDIGTNSVLLTVAEASAPLAIVDQRMTVTRLGQDVDRTGQLHPDAIARTLACLHEYRAAMEEHGVSRALAVGTSAMRDAQGGPAFVQQARDVLGFAPEIISGMREAELTFAGALSGLSHEGPSFVFDIGGGSTELIVGTAGPDAKINKGTSLNIGSVRLTERCQVQDPPTATNIASLRTEVRTALAESGVTVPRGSATVGVAGTVTTLAALAEKMSEYDPGVIHGYTLKKSVVSALVEQLASMTVAERRQLPGLSPGRADVIVAGSVLCEELMSYANASQLIVSDRGVRFGVLAELARSGA